MKRNLYYKVSLYAIFNLNVIVYKNFTHVLLSTQQN